ncbi:MAG: PAS domain-containing protein [Cyanobacteriota bacterium]|nr:PAS domain-containing protein [Cyanobacteriota bacterium]
MKLPSNVKIDTRTRILEVSPMLLLTPQLQQKPGASASQIHYLKAVGEIIKSSAMREGNLPELARQIAEVAGNILKVKFVSLWLFNLGYTKLCCETFYDSTKKNHDTSGELTREAYPNCFAYLASGKLLAADNALEDERLAELREDYLVPKGVRSLLYIPIKIEDKVVGILGLHEQKKFRSWSFTDIETARFLAGVMALGTEKSRDNEGKIESDRVIVSSPETTEDSEKNSHGKTRSMEEIEETKQALEALRQGKQFMELLENINQVFWMTDPLKNQMIYISSKYEEIWGKSCVELYQSPRSFIDSIHPEDRERVIAAFPKQIRGEYDEEYRILRPDGEQRWIRDRAFPIKDDSGTVYRVVGIAEDNTKYKESQLALEKKQERLKATLTKLKQTQAQLIQTEKMSGLGQMVAGIAHEINNPVSFIYGNLTYIEEYADNLLQLVKCYEEEWTEPTPKIEQLCEEIELDFIVEDMPKLIDSMRVGTKRIQEIVNSMRKFSRSDEADIKQVSIQEGIESTLLILRNRLKAKGDKAKIKVIKSYEELPLVECYPAQINQVFMNLLANAIDALEEHQTPEPVISISAEATPSNLVVKIADNGPGIPQKIRSTIFNPFFTTKPVGKGTGLGLSIAYQIVVDKHRGKISCNSDGGKGTEFIITIPLKVEDKKDADG